MSGELKKPVGSVADRIAAVNRNAKTGPRGRGRGSPTRPMSMYPGGPGSFVPVNSATKPAAGRSGLSQGGSNSDVRRNANAKQPPSPSKKKSVFDSDSEEDEAEDKDTAVPLQQAMRLGGVRNYASQSSVPANEAGVAGRGARGDGVGYRGARGGPGLRHGDDRSGEFPLSGSGSPIKHSNSAESGVGYSPTPRVGPPVQGGSGRGRGDGRGRGGARGVNIPYNFSGPLALEETAPNSPTSQPRVLGRGGALGGRARGRGGIRRARPQSEMPVAGNQKDAIRTENLPWPPFSNRAGIYKGEIDVRGIPDGMGELTWPDGCRYEGHWSFGRRQGPGRYWWSNGNMYEGMWKEDKRHGMGSEIIAADKSRFMGIYDRGRPEGDCVLELPGGRRLEINYKGGVITTIKETVEEKGPTGILKSSDKKPSLGRKSGRRASVFSGLMPSGDPVKKPGEEGEAEGDGKGAEEGPSPEEIARLQAMRSKGRRTSVFSAIFSGDAGTGGKKKSQDIHGKQGGGSAISLSDTPTRQPGFSGEISAETGGFEGVGETLSISDGVEAFSPSRTKDRDSGGIGMNEKPERAERPESILGRLKNTSSSRRSQGGGGDRDFGCGPSEPQSSHTSKKMALAKRLSMFGGGKGMKKSATAGSSLSSVSTENEPELTVSQEDEDKAADIRVKQLDEHGSGKVDPQTPDQKEETESDEKKIHCTNSDIKKGDSNDQEAEKTTNRADKLHETRPRAKSKAKKLEQEAEENCKEKDREKEEPVKSPRKGLKSPRGKKGKERDKEKDEKEKQNEKEKEKESEKETGREEEQDEETGREKGEKEKNSTVPLKSPRDGLKSPRKKKEKAKERDVVGCEESLESPREELKSPRGKNGKKKKKKKAKGRGKSDAGGSAAGDSSSPVHEEEGLIVPTVAVKKAKKKSSLRSVMTSARSSKKPETKS